MPVKPALKLALWLLITAAPLHGVLAQTVQPDAIIVTGAALPPPVGMPAYSINSISRADLTNNASGLLENALAAVAGFQEFRRSDSRSANPSAQGATLRTLGGNASSRALMLLDAVPQADPFFGSIPYGALDSDRLGMVTVQRGGGMGAFGAGAVAGTIDMTSASRAQLPLLSAQAFYGSDNATALSAAYSPSLGNGFASLSARWDKGDGFFTTPAAQRTPASVPAAYNSWSNNLRFVAPLASRTTVQFRASLFDDQRTLRFKGADSDSSGQDVSLRVIGHGRWQYDALAYLQARNYNNMVISSTSFLRSLGQRNTPSTGLGGKIELRSPSFLHHQLRIGVDGRLLTGTMYEDTYNANSPTNPLTGHRNAGGQTQNFGAYVEDDWMLGPLVLTGGGRLDYWAINDGHFQATNTSGSITNNSLFPNRHNTQATGRLGARWVAMQSIALRAAAYSGFRLPTLNELYRPFTVFPVTTQANASLTPEQLKGVEGGVDFSPLHGVMLQATVFDNRLNQAIANVYISPNLYQRKNIPAIEVKGLELSAAAKQGAFTLNASYTYSDPQMIAPGLSYNGFTPAQTPHHAASASLSWANKHGATLSLNSQYSSQAYEDDNQSTALPAALTFSGVARIPLRHHLSLIGRVENIFNATIITRNQAGSEDFGAPRRLWIGVKIGG